MSQRVTDRGTEWVTQWRTAGIARVAIRQGQRLAVLDSLTEWHLLELLSPLKISTGGVKRQLSTVSMDFIDNQQGLNQFCKLITMNKICNLSSLILIRSKRINTKDLSAGTISGVSVAVVWCCDVVSVWEKTLPGPQSGLTCFNECQDWVGVVWLCTMGKQRTLC